MNKSFVIALALILALIKGSNGKAITDPNQQAIILNKHNEMRRMAANGQLGYNFGSAAKMYPLTWDSELANVAEQLASSCSYGHDTFGRNYGQNIAKGGGSFSIDPQDDIPGVPNRKASGEGICTNCYANENEAIEFLQYGWISEVKNGPNSLEHFSQMVDDDTFKIGCALNSNCPGSDRYYLVCNYDPRGNMRGTAVYASGSTASQCPNGNSNGLCSGTPQTGSDNGNGNGSGNGDGNGSGNGNDNGSGNGDDNGSGNGGQTGSDAGNAQDASAYIQNTCGGRYSCSSNWEGNGWMATITCNNGQSKQFKDFSC